jgi:hypothetical protein
MRFSRLTVYAPLLLAGAMILPSRADAQFGSIRDRVKKQIEKKAEGDKAPSRSSRAPVTDEYIAQLLKGFAAEAQAADDIGKKSLAENAKIVADVNDYLKRQRAYSEAQAASEKRMADYSACTQPHTAQMMEAAQNQPASVQSAGMAMAQRMASMSPEEQEAFEKKMAQLEREAKAAEKSGDVAEQQRIRGEVEKLTGMSMSNVSAGDRQKLAANSAKAQKAAKGMESCGPLPQMSRVQPPEPVKVRPIIEKNGELALGPVATQEIRDSVEAKTYIQNLRVMRFGNQPALAGAAASGMSTGDYSLGREQVLYFYALPALRGEAEECPPAFKGDECKVLKAHRAEILAAVKRLRDSGAATI